MDEILIKAKSDTAIQSYTIKRELSSVGSEHLPYKQRVIGSSPIVPTIYCTLGFSPGYFCFHPVAPGVIIGQLLQS